MAVEEATRVRSASRRGGERPVEGPRRAGTALAFSGEYDESDAVCEIHAGEGGTDAQDWTEMMLRMYQRWAERRGFSVEIEEVTEGQEAGILSATFIVKGRYAYGLLSAERGVHRLYRISPFDSQARRQTSYAAATLCLHRGSQREVNSTEGPQIDTYRSSGAGGQPGTSRLGGRITHLPAGSSRRAERSQPTQTRPGDEVLPPSWPSASGRARAGWPRLSGPKVE